MNGCIVRLIINHLILSNYISEYIAHQLGLPIYLNPCPYLKFYLSHNHGYFQVAHICTFTLNMGIVPTSTCHIVMSSSWYKFSMDQYSLTHNQYSFFWNIRKYCLSSPLWNYILFDKPKCVLKDLPVQGFLCWISISCRSMRETACQWYVRDICKFS